MKLKALLICICLLVSAGKIFARPRSTTGSSSLGFGSNCADQSPSNNTCPLVVTDNGYPISYASTNTVPGYSGTHFSVVFTSSDWCDQDFAQLPAKACLLTSNTYRILEVSITGIDPKIATLNLRSLVINQVNSAGVSFLSCDNDGISQCMPDPGLSGITPYANLTQTRIDLDNTTVSTYFVLATKTNVPVFDITQPANFRLVADDGNGHVFIAGSLAQVDYAAAGNDETSSAYALTTSNLPATRTENVANAAGTVTDPADLPSCIDPNYPFTNTVWYAFTPNVATLLQLDTSGSNYDTFITVYKGAPSSANEIGCSQDIDATRLQSFLRVETDPQQGSTPYYIMIGLQGLSWDPNLSLVVSAPPLLSSSVQQVSLSAALGNTTSTTFDITAHNSAVTGITASSDSTQFTTSNNCPNSLAVGSSCIVTVNFTPTQVSVSGTLTISSNGSPQLQVVLKGSGSGALATLESASVVMPRQLIGTKSALLPVCSGCSSPMLVGDADGDGKLDILASGSQGSISVYFSDGKGDFPRTGTFSACATTNELVYPEAIADINKDGKPDIVVMCWPKNQFGTYASVLLGNGNGTYQSAKPAASATACNGTNPVQVVDLNHDGILDLVTSCPTYYGGVVELSLGKGDGTFQSPSEIYPCADQLLFVDLNADNYPDMVAACKDYGAMDVFLNDGTGAFPNDLNLLSGQASPPNNYQLKAVVTDLNNDGKPDIAYSQYGLQTPLGLFIGDGKGNFSAQSGASGATFEGGQIISTTTTLPAASDLIVEDTSAARLYYLQNDGTASFTSTALPGTAGQSYTYAPAADIDGYRNLYSAFAVWPNLAQPFTYHLLDEVIPSSVNSLFIKDIDGDGRYDFIGSFTDYSYSANTPEISIATGGLDGRLLVPQLFSIRDAGTVPLQISNVQVSGPFTQTNNCSVFNQLGYYKECSVSISYAPTTTGVETGTLTITDNTYNSPHVIPLSATGVATTTTQLSYQPQTVYAGEPITFAATVNSANADGNVQFKSAGTVFDTEALSSGTASSTVLSGSAGTYTFSASYLGSTTYLRSDSSSVVVVVLPKAQPQVSLSGVASQYYFGVPITLSAKLPADASGQVQFYDGSHTIGSPAVITSGNATAVVSGLAAGQHSVSASYSGDYHYNPAQSPAASFAVVAGTVLSRPSLPSRPTSTPGTSAVHPVVRNSARRSAVTPGGLATNSGVPAIYPTITVTSVLSSEAAVDNENSSQPLVDKPQKRIVRSRVHSKRSRSPAKHTAAAPKSNSAQRVAP